MQQTEAKYHHELEDEERHDICNNCWNTLNDLANFLPDPDNLIRLIDSTENEDIADDSLEHGLVVRLIWFEMLWKQDLMRIGVSNVEVEILQQEIEIAGDREVISPILSPSNMAPMKHLLSMEEYCYSKATVVALLYPFYIWWIYDLH